MKSFIYNCTIKKISISLIILLIITGCNKKNNSIDETVKNKFEGIYSIEIKDKVYEENSSEYIRKMKANDMDFYIYTYNQGNGLDGDTYIYTSLLSSVYEKYKNQIQNMSIKYGLNIAFNFSASKYETKDYFDNCHSCKGHFITINATSSQNDSILSFVNEVLSINEIKSLYDIWLKNDNYKYFVYDYSEIIIDGNNFFPQSIFDYYKSN